MAEFVALIKSIVIYIVPDVLKTVSAKCVLLITRHQREHWVQCTHTRMEQRLPRVRVCATILHFEVCILCKVERLGFLRCTRCTETV